MSKYEIKHKFDGVFERVKKTAREHGMNEKEAEKFAREGLKYKGKIFHHGKSGKNND